MATGTMNEQEKQMFSLSSSSSAASAENRKLTNKLKMLYKEKTLMLAEI